MMPAGLQRALLTLAGAVVAVLIAVAVSSVAILAAGANPVTALQAMFDFGDTQIQVVNSVTTLLNRAVPLFIAGLAVAIGFRMNLFNIGVEGQYRIAAVVAAFVGSQFELPGPVQILLIIVVAMVVGGLYALIPAVLKVTRGVNEVIATIMLNYIAINLAAFLVRGPFAGERAEGQLTTSTPELPESAWFPNLNVLFEMFGLPAPRGGGLWGFLAVAVVAGLIIWLVLERTRFGFEVKATGLNASAALASGVDPKRMVISAMVLSGAVAGLIGLPEILGRTHAYGSNFTAGLGFLGIAVALLGRNKPGGIAVAALLFAFLDRAAAPLQFADIPPSVITIIQGTIVLMVVIANEVTIRMSMRNEERRAARQLATTDQAGVAA
ncbi:ABC transporter permease [Planomonospora parontospora]|uniref:ABC transporter permease n=1 Tax=Planomonospora parontospora TaxID=58119 RepID=UPI0019982EF2|nr:ABC transporter permease [Planomonospora parontospora]GGL05169.1 ABC transporter permease [Planomonospora parontospora subsp. antibiotica]GII14357.1 ABC transporter permease [Planomonospora parontospora subsp. antibiotica]